jgi:hypothetical protein
MGRGAGPVAAYAGNQPLLSTNMFCDVIPHLPASVAASIRPTIGAFARPATPSQGAAGGGPAVAVTGGGAGRPVGTAAGSVRPGSGFRRLGTAGPGAAPPGAAVGLHTEVNVAHRPATQQGLQAMPTKPLGPGRQIADRAYYQTELRQKLADLNSETNRMKEELIKANKDNTKYVPSLHIVFISLMTMMTAIATLHWNVNMKQCIRILDH